MKFILLFASLAWSSGETVPVEDITKPGALQAIQQSFDDKFSVRGGTITGHTNLSSTTVNDSLSVDGAVDLNSTVNVDGAATFSSSFTVQSDGRNIVLSTETATDTMRIVGTTGRIEGNINSHIYPWRVQIPIYFGEDDGSNSGGLVANSSQLHGWLRDVTDTSNCAAGQNSYIEYNVILASGTWTMQVYTTTNNTDRGIASFQIDGVEVGTRNQYGAGSDTLRSDTFTGISVTSSGKHAVRVIISSKDAASSGYCFRISGLEMRRTL